MQGVITTRRITATAVAFFVAVSTFLVAIPAAHAEPFRGYEALHVFGGGNITMRPGETKQVTVGFQNLGPNAWKQEGDQFVSVYTREPNYRDSVFENSSWFRKSQPARLHESVVTKGQKGHVSFMLKAPSQTGVYEEVFQLAAEDRAWIPGTRFVLKVNVTGNPAPTFTPSPQPTPSTPSVAPAPKADGYSAMLLLRSAKNLRANGGESVSYRVGVKNTGSKTWGAREIRTPQVQIASFSEKDTKHSSWVSDTKLVANTSGQVKPGALDFIDFSFTAPKAVGHYLLRYQLVVDDVVVPNFHVDIPIEVTSNAPDALNAPPNPQHPFVEGQKIEEPILRVGILIVDEETAWEVHIRSQETSWKLMDTEGALLGEFTPGQKVGAFYKNGRYYFNRGKGIEQSTYPLRFVPDNELAVMEVTNWDRRLRGSDRPYNRYRGVLEIRYNDHKDRTWLINELPMEWYLKGLGETSNISHLEYQKALITAARTYAFYHWSRNTKRVKEHFHVTGYADDQVYRGYDQEEQSPRIVDSAEKSAGVIVTYDGEYAITPYFSRSDGRTRDWSEVWGGDVPWIKGKPAPCDKKYGRPLWGHGVGMSATEALCMAKEGGKTWDEILKYFYTGIELERKW